MKSADIKAIRLPPKCPRMNAFAERWVRSVKSECLSNLIFFSERSLMLALKQYIIHYHEERNHQGKSNVLLSPSLSHHPQRKDTTIECRERLNGMLKYYHRKDA